jgi:hypothetical protein
VGISDLWVSFYLKPKEMNASLRLRNVSYDNIKLHIQTRI